MNLTAILLVILVLLLIGSFPRWSYSKNWGYVPSGAFALIGLVVLVLLMTGRLESRPLTLP